jgi:hypothetical protein
LLAANPNSIRGRGIRRQWISRRVTQRGSLVTGR